MNRRNLSLLVLLLLVVVVEILVFSPKDTGLVAGDIDSDLRGGVAGSSSGRTSGLVSSESSGQIMQDFHLIESKPSGKEWELWSKRAEKPKDQEEWRIQGVRVRFYASSGVEYIVIGDRGVINTSKKDIKIIGGVETKSSNGYVFKSEQIVYESLNRVLKSPGPIAMQGFDSNGKMDLSLNGIDMISDFSNNRIEIKKNVQGKKLVKSDLFAAIRADRALLSGRDQTAEFYGAVTIDYAAMRISGPIAKFRYSSVYRDLEGIDVEGGIKVTDPEKFATSQTVNLNFNEDRIVFDGDPRVVQSGDEISGDRIVFFNGGKKVRVENVRAKVDADSGVAPGTLLKPQSK
jgi:LPS export ABC transporter protein LptC